MVTYSGTGIIGHERQQKALSLQLEQNTASHAYFFQGPQGIGRFRVAMGFARQLLCQNHPPAMSGDACRSCDLFARGSHPDYLVLEKLEGKNSISIDQVREMIKYVQIGSYLGGRKAVIIRDADDMPADAQNSLLKTLEEPPAHAHFILLGKSQDSVLDTVLSRCRLLAFSRVPRLQAAEYLSACGVEAAEQDLWLSFFGGEIGAIVSILADPAQKKQMQEQISMYTRLLRMSPSDRLNYVRGLGKISPADIQVICSSYEILWNAVLLEAVSSGSSAPARHPLIGDFIRSAGKCTVRSIQQALESIVKLRQEFKAGMNAQLHVENLLLGLPICLE